MTAIIIFFLFFFQFFRNNRADYFVGVIYSCEVAVPFISIRYILAQVRKIMHFLAGIRFCLTHYLLWMTIVTCHMWTVTSRSSLTSVQSDLRATQSANN